jgi:hypothetical protein
VVVVEEAAALKIPSPISVRSLKEEEEVTETMRGPVKDTVIKSLLA